MYKWIIALSLFLILPASALGQETTNPKSLATLDAELIMSGHIESTGLINEVKMKMYVPQEDIKSIEVTPNNWEYVNDTFDNRMIEITWNNPSSFENYEIKMKIENEAKTYDKLDKDIWFFKEAKKETPSTRITDEMREFAFGEETDLEKAIRLMLWLEQNFPYDNAFLENPGSPRSAIEIWELERAVSGEYSNLLVALLRSQGIAGRVVFSYTFPQIKDSFEQDIGHGWAEVYVDGRWVPLDVTFFEAGYIDAAHIKFADLMEHSITEEISTLGPGKITWVRNPMKVNVLNYTTYFPEIIIQVEENLKGNEVTLVEVEIVGECMIQDLDLKSCVSGGNNPFFEISDRERKFWFCTREKIYWIIKSPDINRDIKYTCNLSVFETLGSSFDTKISISKSKSETESFLISGPNQVTAGEVFSLRSPTEGFFFSPNFTDTEVGSGWDLAIDFPGNYKFYFYDDGEYGEKVVEVLVERSFKISNVQSPTELKKDEWFLVNFSVENLVNKILFTTLKVEFQNQIETEELIFDPLETREFNFNFTSSEVGKDKILISLESTNLISHTEFLEVNEKKTPVQNIIDIIFGFFEVMSNFFSNLFNL